ncbi:Alpha,alpha-trehalose-phosphate synthase [Actinokineospora spheciospongiae]|uniref:Alpha,alpha-trehalose-phosphate synthase n=1 Tax=Actinokineospora spheciospongiae TaxID=909613 RepID=W7IRZ7_9PSEU|nr:trehalose-6-phosphate synthase [Actinokineospora spheciospongiae]EWC63695.1 Alpha,alpha-trehalose-phosphate synthase [Actinokineospora spheciospongiae]
MPVLVTDLDGTLLAGTPAERAALLAALTPDITVVFATGRGRASVAEVLRDPLVPRPAWVIGDVGATVYDGSLRTVPEVQDPLRRGWPGAARVRAALRGFPLAYQEGVPQEGRCSYLAEEVTAELVEAVRALGCDLLHSGGRFLDVLPRGVDKGAALRALAAHRGWSMTDVLVAGDSLNDLSLFTTGARGVVVGGAEPGLTAAVGPGATHRPGQAGAAAILAELRALGWVDDRGPLVVGYHRPPVVPTPGGWRPPGSPNGILPTLTSLFAQGLDAVWATTAVHTRTDDHGTGLPLAFLPLTRAQWSDSVHRACKETLWPVLVSRPDLLRFDARAWSVHRGVSERFAEHVSALARPGAVVWLHDYNLWLVPGLLRAARPDLVVGLFHHTPFPEPAVFDRLPVAEEVRESLTRLDWAGFHTRGFAENFRRAVPGGPAVGVHPLGIDRPLVADLARAHAPDRTPRLVLSVERLDYAKAPVAKVDAVDELLRRRPDLRGELVFRLVCPPPEPGVTAYDTTGRDLARRVAEVNRRWSTGTWRPVEHLPGLPFPEVVRQYAAADVFWVTSLRDGMNLTALEFVAAQVATGGTGVLVLSRCAGAAERLAAGALLTDPASPEDLVSTVETALALPVRERRARLRRLGAAVGHTRPIDWAADILAATTASRAPRPSWADGVSAC